MTNRQGNYTHIFHTVFLIVIIMLCASHSVAATGSTSVSEFPPDLQSYNDAGKNILQQLINRIQSNPFNLVGSLIFLLAIIHTFLASKFTAISHQLEHEHNIKKEQGFVPRNSVAHGSRFMHFMGEIEVVFGLWAVALVLTIVFFHGWKTAVDYMSHKVNFTEALFVVVIMTLASTRPILKLSEIFMNKIATLLGGTLIAWWLTILTFGPLLGSLITEPAAMTISALLLARKFYILKPTSRFKYATLAWPLVR